MMMQGLTLPAQTGFARALMTSSALLALPAAAQAQSSAETPRPQIAQNYASAANAIEAAPGRASPTSRRSSSPSRAP
jgi:predicted outer membrane protein